MNWRTVSKVDGHVTGGSFAFGIGIQPPSGAAGTRAAKGGSLSTGSTPAPAAVAGLWLLYWGLALLAAAGATGVLVFGWRLPGQAREVIAAGWLSAAAGILTMILSEQAAAGVPFGELFRAATGRSLLTQAAAVAVCGVAAFFAARRPAGPRLAVLGAAAAGALFVHTQAGHAETRSPVRLLNVTDQWLHMLAAGVWAAAWSGSCSGSGAWDRQARASAVRRFSQLAFAAVAVIAVTGVLRAVPEVGSLGALASTSFGVALSSDPPVPGADGNCLAEPVPAGAEDRQVCGYGAGRASSRRGGWRRGGSPGARGSGRQGPGGRGWRPGARECRRRGHRLAPTLGQIRGGPGCHRAAGGRGAQRTPPASFVEAAGQKTASASVIATGSDFATTARVRLTASPGTAGPNRFQVQVLRYDANSPLPARSVRLEFSLPSNPNVASILSLARSAGGIWTGQGTNLSIDGQWDIDVVVQEPATRSTCHCGCAPGGRPSRSASPGSQASRACTRSSWRTAAACRCTCSR